MSKYTLKNGKIVLSDAKVDIVYQGKRKAQGEKAAKDARADLPRK